MRSCLVRRDSRAGVRDTHRDLAVSISLDPYVDRSGVPALRHRLDGVAGQVQHHLLNLDSVDKHRRQVGRNRRFEPDVAGAALNFDELQVSVTSGPTSVLARSESMLFHHRTERMQHVARARGLFFDLIEQIDGLSRAGRRTCPSHRRAANA